jgi:1-deoxy-D-xylulose-5-phosphate synthase
VAPKAQPVLLEIGKAEVLAEGTDVALIPLGSMGEMAAETKVKLEAQGLSVALINPRWIKPMDAECLVRFGRQCRVLCTFEDHVLHNGFGAGVIELLHDAGVTTKVERIGWPDEFIEHGKVDILREKHGMTSDAAVAKILPHFQRVDVAPPLSPAR